MNLMDWRAHDGSRQFAAIPEVVSWAALRDHIAALPGAQITRYLTDQVTEVWIDFSYRGYAMSVNNQFGEFWFFVDDPNCPDSILISVCEHCTQLLRTQ
ncbi:MAG: hypothetical protein ACYC35_29855 [Pirellulales bacterium]